MTITMTHVGTTNWRRYYAVGFFDDYIEVAVTSNARYLSIWIEKMERFHRHRLDNGLIVGLDVEWRPNFVTGSNNPVAVLQLCVGHRCVVFQIYRAEEIPQSLVDFLGDECYTFVGVGIQEDVRKLYRDYGLCVANTVDLRELAASRLDNPRLRNASLTRLANEVLDVNYAKPSDVTMSNWDVAVLSKKQIAYACIDGYLSFEIGKCLDAADD